MDETLIMEIWDIFKEYVPDKNKDTAANQYVDFLLGKDVDINVLEGFLGYDTHLDSAISAVVDLENSPEADSGDDPETEDY